MAKYDREDRLRQQNPGTVQPAARGDDIDLGDAMEIDLGDAVEFSDAAPAPPVTEGKAPSTGHTPESMARAQEVEEGNARTQRWAGAHDWARRHDAQVAEAQEQFYGELPEPSADWAVSVAEQAYERPIDAAVGFGQGITSNLLDELGAGAGARAYADVDWGAVERMERAQGQEFEAPTLSEMSDTGEDVVDEATSSAQEMSPELYDTAFGTGAVAQGLAVPMPSGAGIQGARGMLARPAISAAYGGGFTGLAGAGAAEEGHRMEGFAESAPTGLVYGLGFGVAGEGARTLARAPGALQAGGRRLQELGDDLRLSASGIRGPRALAEADQRFAPPLPPGGAPAGPHGGRRELARMLRERQVGDQILGVGPRVPTPHAALDHGVQASMDAGPRIGNPIRGPRHLGETEMELDAMGAYVDRQRIADEIQRAAGHERGFAGSAYDAVREHLADPIRGGNPAAITAARAEAQQLAERAAELNASAIRAQAVGSESAEVLAREYEAANRAAQQAEQRLQSVIQANSPGPMRFSAGHQQRQMIQRGEWPGVPEQYVQQASDIINQHLVRAAQAVETRGAAQAPVNMGMMADRVAATLQADGASPAVIEQITNHLRSQPSVPVSQIQSFLQRFRQNMAPPAAAGAGTQAGRRGARTPRVPVPPQYLSHVDDVIRGESDRVAQEWQDAYIDRYARERAAEQAEMAAQRGEAVDMDALIEQYRARGTPTRRWIEDNQEYTLGRYLTDYARPTASSGLDMGMAGALRRAATGSPGSLVEHELLSRISPMATDYLRGASARVVEGAAVGSQQLGGFLHRLLGENPQALGRFAQPLMQAARQGTGGVAAYHYQQAMRDQEYRDMLEENGISWSEEDGADPEVYDILTEGLTTEGEY